MFTLLTKTGSCYHKIISQISDARCPKMFDDRRVFIGGCKLLFTEYTDASMSQTMLAWVSTGLRRIIATITTNWLKTLQLPIQVQTKCFFKVLKVLLLQLTQPAGSKFQLSFINNCYKTFFLTFSLDLLSF